MRRVASIRILVDSQLGNRRYWATARTNIYVLTITTFDFHMRNYKHRRRSRPLNNSSTGTYIRMKTRTETQLPGCHFYTTLHQEYSYEQKDGYVISSNVLVVRVFVFYSGS